MQHELNPHYVGLPREEVYVREDAKRTEADHDHHQEGGLGLVSAEGAGQLHILQTDIVEED